MLALLIAKAAAQNQVQVLHAFTGAADGGGLQGSVAFDAQGRLYGVTFGGGLYDSGTVFQLTPEGGEWSETVLHDFSPLSGDGSQPFGGPILDSEGNIYGTTPLGGAHGHGIAYQLASGQDGYTEVILYEFCSKPGCTDGSDSWGSPVIADNGSLYGTGYTAFQLSPAGTSWTEAPLHLFAGKNGDGYFSQAGPLMDAAGNLYGTTGYGGPNNAGIVYQLQPVRTSVGGFWKENILHTFGGFPSDGIRPGLGSLTMDGKGNLYGATFLGGSLDSGVVYRLIPLRDGIWQESILYNFTPAGWGSSGVVFGPNGNLYGTAINGGGWGCGVIYKLSPTLPTPNSQWQYTLLHSFNGSDGCQPDANLTLGPDGNLYGTTVTGGSGGAGVVFQITP